ncbi:NAD(P)/FAD-dependent oxidoreductase [Streptomyces meridianus]|uniref:FAD-binding oxidoreductase n=1 Tax=Streptomyces meridianus TaxID=2938945 RepID=A0ABT0X1W6_9ACTN|nr:FAD-binding oxidoreductase [Streptomyces meridianus]MCM2576541.1 FAD-binding oxidoreductase [Streptomyces meridianus]
MSETSDFLVLGGGIAGAAASHHLAEHGRVTLLEAEPRPGLHSTALSAGLFSEYYGNRAVRTLTTASRPFYEEAGLLRPRGVLALAPPGTGSAFEQALRSGAEAPEGVAELEPDEALRLCPIVRPGFERALLRRGACDVDVAGAHRLLLRRGRVVTDARVTALSRNGGGWVAETTAGRFTAPVVVNAAGAWADAIAVLAGVAPQGMVPLRRTAAVVAPPDGHDISGWPMITDIAGTYYARPEAGGLLLSPADAAPMPPGPVHADPADIATALTRFERATTVPAGPVRRSWAGLRTSTPDDTPVIGEAAGAPGFFWLAALGGYGVQSAPAAGLLLAHLVTGTTTPPPLSAVTAALAPDRTARI